MSTTIRIPLTAGTGLVEFNQSAGRTRAHIIPAEQFVPSPTPVLNGEIGRLMFRIPDQAPPGAYMVTVTKAEVNGAAASAQNGSVRVEAVAH